MKVAINVSKLNKLHQTRGIGVYAKKLIEYLPKVDKTNHYSLAQSPEDLEDVDIIHYPTFDFFFHTLPIKESTPRIITIHDVTPLVFADHFKPGIRGTVKFSLQKRALKNTDAVITDSQSSKRDIIRYLHVPEDKISVVYLAVDKKFKVKSKFSLTKTKRALRLNKPFILFVGDFNYNKNVPALINAFSKLEREDLELVFVSNAWSTPSIEEVKSINHQLDRLAINNRVKKISKLPSDSTTSLVNLYNLATVYVQPSLYEGFGLPVLEAMASGTPVVSANTGSLPEVCGQSAILVKPNTDALVSGLQEVLSFTPNQRKSLIEKGIKHAARFTWEKTAKDTIKAYKSVISN